MPGDASPWGRLPHATVCRQRLQHHAGSVWNQLLCFWPLQMLCSTYLACWRQQ